MQHVFKCLREVKFIFKTFRSTIHCTVEHVKCHVLFFLGLKIFFTYILVKESNFEAEKYRKFEKNYVALQLCFYVMWPKLRQVILRSVHVRLHQSSMSIRRTQTTISVIFFLYFNLNPKVIEHNYSQPFDNLLTLLHF